MVMELLDGADLSKDLKTSVLLVPDAVDFIIQACDAIAEAHAHGIVHRDIKPANLFLTHRADDSPLVKVLDFGISKVIGGEIDNLTKTSATMGSVRYMSPEQMREARAVDHRTDIYALGVSLYELLGGEQPFRADTLPRLCAEVLSGVPTPLLDLRPEVPVELARVIEKAFARERGERHQSVAELVAALAPFAPSRSQREIERICRMGGLDPAGARGGTPERGSDAQEAERRTAPFPVPGAPVPAERTSGAAILPTAGSPENAFAKGVHGRAPLPVATDRDLAPPAAGPPRARKGTATVAVSLALALVVGASLALLTMRKTPPAPETSASTRPPMQTSAAPAVSEMPRLAAELPSAAPAVAIPAVAATSIAPSASIPGRPSPGGPGGRPKGKGTAAPALPAPPEPPPAKRPEDYGI
jgi:eukaryotic-like serine/threonine-protein kinase